jgi:hypothetical protein
MPSRRQIIAGVLGGLAAVGGWRYWRSNEEQAILLVLRKRLDYLQLDPAGTRAFAIDLVSRGLVSSKRLKLIGASAPLYLRVGLNGHDALQATIRHGEERVVSTFLLSSDFFVNGADTTRIVRYLGLYDPLKACSNPFARFPGRDGGGV